MTVVVVAGREVVVVDEVVVLGGMSPGAPGSSFSTGPGFSG